MYILSIISLFFSNFSPLCNMGETNLTENTSSRNTFSSGRKLLRSYLNKNMKIKLTDGRILIGIFLCTDKDANVILGT